MESGLEATKFECFNAIDATEVAIEAIKEMIRVTLEKE
jgi:hypothetical protein